MHANCKTEEKKTPNDPAHDLGQVGGKQRTERARRSAHIRFDEDWDEWVVMFYLDGRHQTRADYGIHEMISDSKVVSVSALLSGFTDQELLTIEQLLKPAYDAGIECMDDLANGFLKASISGNYRALELTAWMIGALGHNLNIIDVTLRLWDCDPDNQERWGKGK